jgi:alpha/beta superfamily hydrolase
MEELVQLISGDNQLEGLLDQGNSEKGVIITHPHPLYGGDMYNPVVESIARAYKSKDYTTLRFNFRGVGNSRGSYGDGPGEKQDVLSAVSYLKENGSDPIDLAGYSFGAWVIALLGCSDISNGNMLMVSPPVAFIEFKNIGPLPCLKLVVTGDRDDIAPAGRIQTMIPNWKPEAQFEKIEFADHFYSGALAKLETVISNAI